MFDNLPNILRFLLVSFLERPASAFCGFMEGPINDIGVMVYDKMFTRVDQFHFGGLDLTTGIYRAPKTGIYLVNFDTQIDSGPGPRTPEYSAYIRFLILC